MKSVIVTTSWDDGHKCDMRMAALLRKYGARGTFYVCPETHEFAPPERLTPDEIRMLGAEFEIGAHTMTHPRLSQLDAAAARGEIVQSKKTLEAIIGAPVSSFCYPYGDHTEETKRIVREAGFDRARNINRFVTRSPDRWATGTSMDTYDHLRDGMGSVLHLCGRRPWQWPRMRRWDNSAKAMFALARDRGEVFHLWGHSREIDVHGDWDRLDAFLAWLAEQPGVVFATNGEVPLPATRALITTPYFKPHSGGLEEYSFQIAQGLQDAHGWQVSVVTSGELPEDEGAGDYQGIRVHRLPYRLTLSNTPFGLSWRRKLKEIIATERPDLIITHAPVPGMIDVTASVARDIPLVVTYHFGSMLKGNWLFDPAIRLYERFQLPRVLRQARGVIVTSGFVQRADLLRPFQTKSVVINPGIAGGFCTPRPPRAPGHTLMHVGGLKRGEQHKDLLTSLQVTAELKTAYPDIRLMVVGNGSHQPFFQSLAGELDITENVDFRGYLTGDGLIAAYHEADVLITPSRNEAFGMVLIEAMATGLPVVASRVGGMQEVVSHGETGLLAEPGNVTEFVRLVSRLFDDPAIHQRLSRNGLMAATAWEWPTQVQRTAEFVASVIPVPAAGRPPVV
jgi:glycosyltransferase involved in cell wall biosynthesis